MPTAGAMAGSRKSTSSETWSIPPSRRHFVRNSRKGATMPRSSITRMSFTWMSRSCMRPVRRVDGADAEHADAVGPDGGGEGGEGIEPLAPGDIGEGRAVEVAGGGGEGVWKSECASSQRRKSGRSWARRRRRRGGGAEGERMVAAHDDGQAPWLSASSTRSMSARVQATVSGSEWTAGLGQVTSGRGPGARSPQSVTECCSEAISRAMRPRGRRRGP